MGGYVLKYESIRFNFYDKSNRKLYSQGLAVVFIMPIFIQILRNIALLKHLAL